MLIGASLGVALAPAPRAWAQTLAADTARATELFKSGKAAFAKGDLAEAERLFAEALSLRKSSDIAANLAQSQLEQQKYRAAAENFTWALANLLPSATDAQRRAVESGLSRAHAEVAVLRLEIQPEGSDVLVGPHPVGRAPIAGGVFVDPGEVIISVRHPGYVSIDKRLIVGKGTEQAIEISLTPKDGVEGPAPAASAADLELGSSDTAPTPPPADRPRQKSLVPAFVATGVAVAGGVTGLVLRLGAGSTERDADQLRNSLNAQGGCNGAAPDGDCEELRAKRESVDSSRNLALGAFVVGGVAALAAGYFYWDALSSRGSASAGRDPQRARVRPSLEVDGARGGGGVQALRLGVSGAF